MLAFDWRREENRSSQPHLKNAPITMRSDEKKTSSPALQEVRRFPDIAAMIRHVQSAKLYLES